MLWLPLKRITQINLLFTDGKVRGIVGCRNFCAVCLKSVHELPLTESQFPVARVSAGPDNVAVPPSTVAAEARS